MIAKIGLSLGLTLLMVLSKAERIEGPCNDTITNVTCEFKYECFVYTPDTLGPKRRSIPDNSDNALNTIPDNSEAEIIDIPGNTEGEVTNILDNSKDELIDDTQENPVNEIIDSNNLGKSLDVVHESSDSETNHVNKGKRKRLICLATKDIEENRRVSLGIDCPPKLRVGHFPQAVDRFGCGPQIKSLCEADSECKPDQICCHDGCWFNCIQPVVSRYSVGKKLRG